MRILIKRTKRRKTEHGYQLDEIPEVICVNETFPPPQSDGCGNCACNRYSVSLGSVPYKKYVSECEEELCPQGRPTWRKAPKYYGTRKRR